MTTNAPEPGAAPHAISHTPSAIGDTPYAICHSQQTIIELESAHTSGVYPKRPLAIIRGQGARVWDATGREYIDCAGGQGSANLGHAHPAIVAAVAQQAGQLITCPEIFYNDRRAELLAALAGVAPAGMERAFLCNSGTEAMEAAIKFARLSTGRPGIVAAVRGFHGRTMGALSATWNRDYRQPFEPLVPGFSHVPYNDSDALAAAVTDGTAAVILEVVQGEGGVHPGTPDFLAAAQAICRERGALLILDEIQTGYGRTGKLFACQHYDLAPDLLTVAKSMAGGLPMGACLIGPRVTGIRPMTHGSTFGGNPLACAAALATLEAMTGTRSAQTDAPTAIQPPKQSCDGLRATVPHENAPSALSGGRQPAVEACPERSRGGAAMSQDASFDWSFAVTDCEPFTRSGCFANTETLPDRAARLGGYLQDRLRAIQSPLIREVRGLGLLVGLDLRVKVTPILQRLQALGVLALPAGSTVLRLLPPLVIDQADLDRVVEAIEMALAEQ